MKWIRKLVSLLLSTVLCLGSSLPALAWYDVDGTAEQYNTVAEGAAIKKDGSLWMWGYNRYGQLGIGSGGNAEVSGSPVQNVPIKVMDDVISVSRGNDFTAAIKEDHSLWMWGANNYGQIGNGGVSNDIVDGFPIGSVFIPVQNTPVKIMNDVVSVTCCGDFTAAIKSDGSLWMWGLGRYGVLGDGISYVPDDSHYITKPRKVLDNVAKICCTVSCVAAIKKDGSLWTWGRNDSQLGRGENISWRESSTPGKVMDSVSSVALGGDVTAILKTDNSLWVCGWNDRGYLGSENGVDVEGSVRQIFVPVKLMVNIASVDIDFTTFAVIKTDGSLWMWGNGDYGEMANGTMEESRDPIKVMDDVVYADADGVAIQNDGTVWVWGQADDGKLCNGQYGGDVIGPYGIECQSIAMQSLIQEALMFVKGGYALKEDGSLWTWGTNDNGEVGNGDCGHLIKEVLTPYNVLNDVRLPTEDPPKPEIVEPFTDVLKESYYAEAVLWAVENGVTSGTSATTFGPNQSCTRAQAMTFLWNAAAKPEPTQSTTIFTDVPTGSYYEKAVQWAVENGITSGTSETTFSPDSPCTRAQIVTFLYKSNGSPVVSSGTSFADVEVGSYYEDAVKWAVENHITSGTGETTFGPEDPCTRAQIVTFLFRDTM